VKMVCEVEGCGEELSEGTGSKGGPMLCKWCRGPRSYWSKKPLAQRRERFGKLALYRSRLEYYDPRVSELLNEAKKSVAATRKRAAEAADATKH